MITISNKEAALLGLLSEKPKHAYEIESDIKERNMRDWTDISMSSVYKLLKKLKDKGFLNYKINLSKNNVAQKIYSLTKKGEKGLREKLMEIVSTWKPIINPLDIGLTNLELLNKKEVLERLNNYLKSLDEAIDCYGSLEKFLVNSRCDIAKVQLATRRIFILNGERSWLIKFMRDYENEN